MSNIKMRAADRATLFTLMQAECPNDADGKPIPTLCELIKEGELNPKVKSALRYAVFVLYKSAMRKDGYRFMDALYEYLNDNHIDTVLMLWAYDRLRFELKHCTVECTKDIKSV